MKRTLRAMVIACLIAALLCPAWAEGGDDPVVVRVGDVTFTKSQLQSAVDTGITVSEMMNREYLTDEERLQQRDEAINRFIGAGLIEMKLRESGRDGFTEEEEETLKATAMNQYQGLWQGIWDRMQEAGEDLTEAQVTQLMEEEGYSSEAIYEELKINERRYRAIEMYCLDLTLTEDMVEKYYETQFIWPDKERYENDLERYEREVLAFKNESFYTPEGYRAIQQILLEYPDAVTKGLRNDTARVEEAAQNAAEALQKVTEAAITGESWDDIVEPRAAYEAAAQQLVDARKALTDRRRALTLPLIQTSVDEINAAFEAGIDFKSLIGKYSTDQSEQNVDAGGYPVHPDSKNWPEEFIEAVRALQKPGDLSEPVLTDMGIHILYYASDIPSGPHELTGDERSMLNNSARYYYQTLELEKLMEDWQDEYDIETHPELLDD